MIGKVKVRYKMEGIGFATIYMDETPIGTADWEKGVRRMSDYDGWTFKSYNDRTHGIEPNQLVAISKILQKLNKDVPDPWGLKWELKKEQETRNEN